MESNFNELVVDISYHQGDINFQELKDSGVYGVIIRAGYGNSPEQEDPKFEEYYSSAKEVGLHVGAYWYSYSLSPSETRKEMEAFMQVVEGKDFDMFLAYDVEDESQLHLDQDTTSWMCETALNIIEEHGYIPVLYTNPDWLTYHLSYVEMSPDTNYWVAAYDEGHEQFTNSNFAVMHQYGVSEPSRGIGTSYDVNICYVDFPENETYSVDKTETIEEIANNDNVEVNESNHIASLTAIAAMICIWYYIISKIK